MIKPILLYLKEWIYSLWQLLRLRFKSSVEKDLEIIALRSQLALYINQTKSKKITKPNSSLAFRQLWVLISSFYSGWKPLLHIFVPSTITEWHKRAFKIYWTNNSL